MSKSGISRPEQHTCKGTYSGQSTVPLVVALVAAVIVLIIIVAVVRHSPCDKHVKKMHVTGELLTPTADGHGRYAYKADDGDWWVYYWIITSNDGYSAPNSLPPGGTWSRLPQAPEEDEILINDVPEEVDETNAGEPETEAEVENQSTESEGTVEQSEPSESTPDSDAGDASGGGDD